MVSFGTAAAAGVGSRVAGRSSEAAAGGAADGVSSSSSSPIGDGGLLTNAARAAAAASARASGLSPGSTARAASAAAACASAAAMCVPSLIWSSPWRCFVASDTMAAAGAVNGAPPAIACAGACGTTEVGAAEASDASLNESWRGGGSGEAGGRVVGSPNRRGLMPVRRAEMGFGFHSNATSD